jgi:hypothetical protein
MVNAIARTIPTVKTVNTNLAGFGAMYPSWRRIDVSMPDFRGAKRKRCVDYFTLHWLLISPGRVRNGECIFSICVIASSYSTKV